MKRTRKIKVERKIKPPSSTLTIRLPVATWDAIWDLAIPGSRNAVVGWLVGEALAARGIHLPTE